MLEKLKAEVLIAYQELKRCGLDKYAGGIVSGIDRESGLIVVKSAAYALVVDMQGNVVEGNHAPSADIRAHIALYRSFPNLGGIVRPYARFASIFARAGMDIPVLGTFHKSCFHGEIPCVASNADIGKIFRKQNIDPLGLPAALVLSHSAYAWGRTVIDAVENAAALEETANIAYNSMQLDPYVRSVQKAAACLVW